MHEPSDRASKTDMRKKPSILFINRVLYPEKGETGRVLRDLSRAFAQDGWDVSIVSMHTSKGTKPTSKRINIKTGKSLFGKSLFGYMWAWVRLLTLALFHPRTDIVVTMTDPPLLVVVGRLISILKGSRHVHWCQDLYPDLFPVLGCPKILKSLTHWMSKRSFKKCDKIIVIGRCMARKIAAKDIPLGQITVIPNWYNPVQRQKENERRKKPAPKPKTNVKPSKASKDVILDETQKFRVLYAGSIGRAHSIDTIMDSAQELKSINPDIEFTFISDKRGHDKVMKAKNDYGLNNIRLIPYQPEANLKPLMESGDIHIITLNPDAEGLMVPSKFYSAIAANRPSIFIGPKNCEVAKVIKDFDCGEVIEPNDSKSLTAAIKKYREDETTWFKHQEGATEAARRFAPQQSWQVWLQRMHDLMKQP